MSTLSWTQDIIGPKEEASPKIFAHGFFPFDLHSFFKLSQCLRGRLSADNVGMAGHRLKSNWMVNTAFLSASFLTLRKKKTIVF